MGPAPLRALRLPRRGTGGGETPAGRNPRRRQTRRQTAGAGEQPETTEGNRRGSAPGGGWRRAPLAPGVRGQGPGGPSQSEGAPGGPRRRGNGTRPHKGGLGTAAPECGKGPGHSGRAGPHTEDCLRDAGGPQTLGGRVGRLCPPVGPDGPGPNAAPVSGHDGRTGEAGSSGPRRGPPTNPHQSGVEARRPEPKGKGSGRPGRPAQGLPEPQDGPERAGADGPDGPRRPDAAGV